MVAGTKVECAALVSVRLVGMVSDNYRFSGTTGEGDSLASVRTVGLASGSHCGDRHEQ